MFIYVFLYPYTECTYVEMFTSSFVYIYTGREREYDKSEPLANLGNISSFKFSIGLTYFFQKEMKNEFNTEPIIDP